MRQLRRRGAVKKIPKCFGVVRRVAVAVGAGDQEQVLFVLQVRAGILGEVNNGWSEALRACFFGEAFGERLGVAGLRAEQNSERQQRFGSGRARGGGSGRSRK